jgi:hypothetical protein
MECTFDDGIFFEYFLGEPFPALQLNRLLWGGVMVSQSYTLDLFQLTTEHPWRTGTSMDENNGWRTVKERCIAALPVYGRTGPCRLHCANCAAIDIHPGSSCCSTIQLDCCFNSRPNLGFSHVDALSLETLSLLAGSGVLEMDYNC